MDGEISTDEVHELLEADAEVRVVDIRDARSFERGHIPGSDNVPFNQLATRIEDLAGERRVITVCPHGKASVQAARLIGSYEGCADATVESMAGGLEVWAQSYDLAHTDGEATTDVDETGDVDAASDVEPAGSPPF